MNKIINNKKPSILHIIDTLNIGGTERVVTTLANLFIGKSHRVGILIILPSDNPLISEIDNKVEVYFLNRYNKYNPFKCNKIISITNQFDVIHVHMRHNLRYLWFASFFSLIRLKKFFFHDHFGDIKNDKSIDSITKTIMRKSIYIGVSKELCRWSLDKCGVKQTYQLNNIILKEKIVNKSHCKRQGIRLLIVSNIHPRKNIEFAIEIIYELIKKGEYYLDIFGQITDRAYFIQLSNLISALGIEDHITFNSNCISIQPILYRYDLALHPSKSEAGPLVLIEYLAQSLSFITFDTGEVVQQIKNELPILIMNNFEIVKWLDKIYTLLNNDRNLIKEKMGKIYSHNYSSEKYYSRCLNIYQKNLF